MRTRFIFAAAACGFIGLAILTGLTGGMSGVVVLAPPGLLLGFLAANRTQ